MSIYILDILGTMYCILSLYDGKAGDYEGICGRKIILVSSSDSYLLIIFDLYWSVLQGHYTVYYLYVVGHLLGCMRVFLI